MLGSTPRSNNTIYIIYQKEELTNVYICNIQIVDIYQTIRPPPKTGGQECPAGVPKGHNQTANCLRSILSFYRPQKAYKTPNTHIFFHSGWFGTSSCPDVLAIEDVFFGGGLINSHNSKPPCQFSCFQDSKN